jgi:hypothetical protein
MKCSAPDTCSVWNGTSRLEPVFSIMLAAIPLGETMRPLQVIGILVVLVATALVKDGMSAREEVAVVGPIDQIRKVRPDDCLFVLSRHGLQRTQSLQDNVPRNADHVLLIFFVPTNDPERLPSQV